MQHTQFEIEFSKVPEQDPFVYDLNLARDPKRVQELAGFVRAYYHQNSPADEIHNDWKMYQTMIDTAIKFNNLEGLATLWKGIYYHDRDNPDYLHDIYVAAQYGNLKTFQHVLYGYMNYRTLNGVENINYSLLVLLNQLSLDPKESAHKFIEDLKPFVNSKNELEPMSEGGEVFDQEDPEEVASVNRALKYCEFVKAY